jgi:hypothetical protein
MKKALRRLIYGRDYPKCTDRWLKDDAKLHHEGKIILALYTEDGKHKWGYNWAEEKNVNKAIKALKKVYGENLVLKMKTEYGWSRIRESDYMFFGKEDPVDKME